jgi:hypothetical protein
MLGNDLGHVYSRKFDVSAYVSILYVKYVRKWYSKV